VALLADHTSLDSGALRAQRLGDQQRDGRDFVDRLEGLARELDSCGLASRLVAPSGQPPRLRVVNPAMPRLAEVIYVGRSQDGLWWFWWPWAERIAPGDEWATAAALISRVLRVRTPA
jgi:hypothetical protein